MIDKNIGQFVDIESLGWEDVAYFCKIINDNKKIFVNNIVTNIIR